MATLVKNKRVRYDYHVLEEHEAGLVLSGAEVKATKAKKISLEGSYITHKNNELWLINMMISPYQSSNQRNYQPMRDRKLIMHRSEIDGLLGKAKQQGLTLLVESLYTTRGLIKVKVVLARGKKQYDKRAIKKKRDTDRSIARAMRKKV
ncbi:MAG: SsrA-binding protein SmpB [bacterium]|nr:SsrA-binding protein SmpB [bacterium]